MIVNVKRLFAILFVGINFSGILQNIAHAMDDEIPNAYILEPYELRCLLMVSIAEHNNLQLGKFLSMLQPSEESWLFLAENYEALLNESLQIGNLDAHILLGSFKAGDRWKLLGKPVVKQSAAIDHEKIDRITVDVNEIDSALDMSNPADDDHTYAIPLAIDDEGTNVHLLEHWKFLCLLKVLLTEQNTSELQKYLSMLRPNKESHFFLAENSEGLLKKAVEENNPDAFVILNNFLKMFFPSYVSPSAKPKDFSDAKYQNAINKYGGNKTSGYENKILHIVPSSSNKKNGCIVEGQGNEITKKSKVASQKSPSDGPPKSNTIHRKTIINASKAPIYDISKYAKLVNMESPLFGPSEVYIDGEGVVWVIKYKDALFSFNQCLTSALYERAQVPVARCRLIDPGISLELFMGKNKRGLQASDVKYFTKKPYCFVAVEHFEQLLYGYNIDDKRNFNEILDGFIIDVWLANYNVIGSEGDRNIADDGRRFVRVDVGASLEYRAQGAPKGVDFGPEVYEAAFLLNDTKYKDFPKSVSENTNSKNLMKNSATAFANLGPENIKAGLKKLAVFDEITVRGIVEQFYPEKEKANRLVTILMQRKDFIEKLYSDSHKKKNETRTRKVFKWL